MRFTGNGMKQVILILAVMIALIFLAQSKPFVNLGGKDGNLLLGVLTNNSTGNSSDLAVANSTTLNHSYNTTMKLGGDEGILLLGSLENSSIYSEGERNASGNLSDWGSKPRTPPPPPKYDYKSAQSYEVKRMNHLGY